MIVSPNYYIHKAECARAWLYLPPEGLAQQSDLAALFVFNDESTLEKFYGKAQSSTAEIKVQPLAKVLGGQIIEDTAEFLKELAHGVHKAVGLHSVWADPPRFCLIHYRNTKGFGILKQLFWNSFF